MMCRPIGGLQVEIGLGGAFHDELEARLDVLAYQLRQDSVSLGPVFGGYPQEAPGRWIARGAAELVGLHLAQTLETHDVGACVLGKSGDDAGAIRLVERPEGLLAVVDAEERRLRQVDEAARDERLQVA